MCVFFSSERLEASLSVGPVVLGSWDVLHGSRQDLLRWKNARRLFRRLESQWVIAAVWASPSHELSKARKHDGLGPPSLLSAAFPLGLPTLKGRDRAAVEVSDRLGRVTAVGCSVAVRVGVANVVENFRKSINELLRTLRPSSQASYRRALVRWDRWVADSCASPQIPGEYDQ